MQRYKWYSSKVQGIFAILAIHRVDGACANELARHLGYAIEPETRAAWQATRAFRAEQIEKQHKGSEQTQIGVASIDEFKLGDWWIYTITELSSQAIVDYAVCESRDEEVVRELIATNVPEMMISDGCASIAAACDYFADKPHGRCWFHVIQEVLKQFPKEERGSLLWTFAISLYTQRNLKDADCFLNVLTKRYQQTKLEALLNAWEQLTFYWRYRRYAFNQQCL